MRTTTALRHQREFRSRRSKTHIDGPLAAGKLGWRMMMGAQVETICYVAACA
jgi:hypothetical protein